MQLKIQLSALAILLLGLLGCKTQQNTFYYESDTLKVEKLTKNTFRHISYLSTTSFGKVACNGMIVIDQQEALIFDTPTNDTDAKELIDWVENSLNCKVVGVVVSHFHEDCLGGLTEFHNRAIPSYASLKTIELATLAGTAIPQIGFEKYRELQVGTKTVHHEFFGEGHTSDNIVAYFPAEKVLFGGCLIKCLGASKGYLGDANVKAWSRTVQAIQAKYKEVKVIVPGHGQPGNADLLKYTIELFKKS